MKALSNMSALVLVVVGINALIAGYSFMSEPDGSGLQIDTSRLNYSPFTNYFIPGLILFTVNGLMNCVAALLIIFKWKHYPCAIVFQGCMLLGWIVVQVYLLRELNFLHYTFAGIALLLVLMGTGIQHLKKQIHERNLHH